MEMSVVPVTLINLNKVDQAIAFFRYLYCKSSDFSDLPDMTDRRHTGSLRKPKIKRISNFDLLASVASRFTSISNISHFY